MTLEGLLAGLPALGFLTHVETHGGVTRITVAKRCSTPGNRLHGHRGPWMMDDPTGDDLPEVDGPAPSIDVMDGVINFAFGIRVPGPELIRKRLSTFDELFEELLHYWFDADSPMSLEDGFIRGPGRPPGVIPLPERPLDA